MSTSKINAEGAVEVPFYRIPIESIEVEARFNNRFGTYTEADVQDLYDDLSNGRGIRTPVTCRLLPDRRPRLVEGYRRYAAVNLWNSRHKPSESIKLPVIITEMNDEEAMESNILENVVRKNLTPMDVAIGIRNLKVAGHTEQEIAKIYRKSLAWVVQHIKLLSLERHLQKKVHVGEIPGSAAFDLADMSSEHRGIVVVGIENDFKGKFTCTNIRKLGREIGAIGDGHTAVQPTAPAPGAESAESTAGDLLQTSTPKRAHIPRRKQRTVSEVNDYLDSFDGSDKINLQGQEYITLHLRFISGSASNDDMVKWLMQHFSSTIVSVNETAN